MNKILINTLCLFCPVIMMTVSLAQNNNNAVSVQPVKEIHFNIVTSIANIQVSQDTATNMNIIVANQRDIHMTITDPSANFGGSLYIVANSEQCSVTITGIQKQSKALVNVSISSNAPALKCVLESPEVRSINNKEAIINWTLDVTPKQ